MNTDFYSDSPVALITGAAQRIGKAIAQALHQRGVKVAIHCRDSKELAEQLAAQFNQTRGDSAEVFESDLTKTHLSNQLIKQVVKRFGRLDYLVNNASIFYPTPIEQTNDTTHLSYQKFLQVNFFTPVNLLKAAYPYLKVNQGSALNLIDIYAKAGLEKHTEYVASKQALHEATKQLALEFSPEVRVNGISPGAILWPDNQANTCESSRAQQNRIITNTALQRIGQASDISATAVYLLLDASYTTGCTIAVDGGRQLYI